MRDANFAGLWIAFLRIVRRDSGLKFADVEMRSNSKSPEVMREKLSSVATRRHDEFGAAVPSFKEFSLEAVAHKIGVAFVR